MSRRINRYIKIDQNNQEKIEIKHLIPKNVIQEEVVRKIYDVLDAQERLALIAMLEEVGW